MATADAAGMALLRESLADYVDLSGKDVSADTVLAEIGVDSLTLAELLFSLEDRFGVPMADPTSTPRTVGDLLAVAEPYLPPAHRLGLARG